MYSTNTCTCINISYTTLMWGNLSLDNFESSPGWGLLNFLFFRTGLDAKVTSDAPNRLAKPSGHLSCTLHQDKGRPKATISNSTPCEVSRTTTAHSSFWQVSPAAREQVWGPAVPWVTGEVVYIPLYLSFPIYESHLIRWCWVHRNRLPTMGQALQKWMLLL